MSEKVCPVCRKDFAGYEMAVTKWCERCKKLIPFLLKEKPNV
jgi:RNA polymerase subunit RPABC4/transcription elongation factor Spt4